MTYSGQSMTEFRLPVRVYIEDTDAGGIVFYANYLKFFERARSEYLRHVGIEQSLTISTNRLFVVRSCAMTYHAPAKLDDQLEIVATVEVIQGARVLFAQRAERAGATLVSGTVEVVCVSADQHKPKPIPKDLRARLTGHRPEES